MTAPRGTGATLASLMDMTNTHLAQRLEGLADEEWLWEPVSGCWSLRNGEIDWAWPEPVPVPVTTIAWRLHHIRACNEVELHWLQDQPFDWADVAIEHDANEGIRMWERSASDVRNVIAALSDDELEVVTDRGLPRIYWATSLVRENVHHGAEIGVLRDLYGRR